MMTPPPDPNPVPRVGHFSRALLGHFWGAAKSSRCGRMSWRRRVRRRRCEHRIPRARRVRGGGSSGRVSRRAVARRGTPDQSSRRGSGFQHGSRCVAAPARRPESRTRGTVFTACIRIGSYRPRPVFAGLAAEIRSNPGSRCSSLRSESGLRPPEIIFSRPWQVSPQPPEESLLSCRSRNASAGFRRAGRRRNWSRELL